MVVQTSRSNHDNSHTSHRELCESRPRRDSGNPSHFLVERPGSYIGDGPAFKKIGQYPITLDNKSTETTVSLETDQIKIDSFIEAKSTLNFSSSSDSIGQVTTEGGFFSGLFSGGGFFSATSAVQTPKLHLKNPVFPEDFRIDNGPIRHLQSPTEATSPTAPRNKLYTSGIGERDRSRRKEAKELDCSDRKPYDQKVCSAQSGHDSSWKSRDIARRNSIKDSFTDSIRDSEVTEPFADSISQRKKDSISQRKKDPSSSDSTMMAPPDGNPYETGFVTPSAGPPMVRTSNEIPKTPGRNPDNSELNSMRPDNKSDLLPYGSNPRLDSNASVGSLGSVGGFTPLGLDGTPKQLSSANKSHISRMYDERGQRRTPRTLSALPSPNTKVPKYSSSKEKVSVRLNVYHLGKNSVVRGFNRAIAPSKGVYHSGVEIFGQEWSFGMVFDDFSSGITWDDPASHLDHTFDQSVYVGEITISRAEFHTLINKMSEEWLGCKYHVLKRNCHHFSHALLMKLDENSKKYYGRQDTHLADNFPVWVNALATTGSDLISAFQGDHQDTDLTDFDGGHAIMSMWSNFWGSSSENNDSDANSKDYSKDRKPINENDERFLPGPNRPPRSPNHQKILKKTIGQNSNSTGVFPQPSGVFPQPGFSVGSPGSRQKNEKVSFKVNNLKKQEEKENSTPRKSIVNESPVDSQKRSPPTDPKNDESRAANDFSREELLYDDQTNLVMKKKPSLSGDSGDSNVIFPDNYSNNYSNPPADNLNTIPYIIVGSTTIESVVVPSSSYIGPSSSYSGNNSSDTGISDTGIISPHLYKPTLRANSPQYRSPVGSNKDLRRERTHSVGDEWETISKTSKLSDESNQTSDKTDKLKKTEKVKKKIQGNYKVDHRVDMNKVNAMQKKYDTWWSNPDGSGTSSSSSDSGVKKDNQWGEKRQPEIQTVGDVNNSTTRNTLITSNNVMMTRNSIKNGSSTNGSNETATYHATPLIQGMHPNIYDPNSYAPGAAPKKHTNASYKPGCMIGSSKDTKIPGSNMGPKSTYVAADAVPMSPSADLNGNVMSTVGANSTVIAGVNTSFTNPIDSEYSYMEPSLMPSSTIVGSTFIMGATSAAASKTPSMTATPASNTSAANTSSSMTANSTQLGPDQVAMQAPRAVGQAAPGQVARPGGDKGSAQEERRDLRPVDQHMVNNNATFTAPALTHHLEQQQRKPTNVLQQTSFFTTSSGSLYQSSGSLRQQGGLRPSSSSTLVSGDRGQSWSPPTSIINQSSSSWGFNLFTGLLQSSSSPATNFSGTPTGTNFGGTPTNYNSNPSNSTYNPGHSNPARSQYNHAIPPKSKHAEQADAQTRLQEQAAKQAQASQGSFPMQFNQNSVQYTTEMTENSNTVQYSNALSRIYTSGNGHYNGQFSNFMGTTLSGKDIEKSTVLSSPEDMMLAVQQKEMANAQQQNLQKDPPGDRSGTSSAYGANGNSATYYTATSGSSSSLFLNNNNSSSSLNRKEVSLNGKDVAAGISVIGVLNGGSHTLFPKRKYKEKGAKPMNGIF